MCAGFFTPKAWSCPYSIRDSAFVVGSNTPTFDLHIIIAPDMDNRAEFEEWVNTASDVWLTDTPVQATVVTVEETAAGNLRETMGERFPKTADLPSPILVSPTGETFVLPSPAAGEASMDWVMSTFASIIESPARIILRDNLIKALCVALLLEGEDAAMNAKARQAIEAASAKIKNTTTELGRVVTTPPVLLMVSPDDPKEQILLWSLKLNGEGSSAKKTRAGMIVGRGELRGPVLEDGGITAAKMFESFEMLGRSCSCTTSQTWLSGPIVPLQWGSSMDEAVHDELGFNPRDPDALRAISGVVSGVSDTGLGALGLGYRETQFQPIPESADGIVAKPLVSKLAKMATNEAQPAMPSLPGGLAAVDASLGTPKQAGQLGVMILAGCGLLAMGISTMVILRRTRHA